MKNQSRLALSAVIIILGAILLLSVLHKGLKNQTWNFQFQDSQLGAIVKNDVSSQKGTYGVYIESLADGGKTKYAYNSNILFPAASLYKLVLLAAVYQEMQQGTIKPDTQMTDTKANLANILGAVDFGYEDSDQTITYSVTEAIDRVARLSDNFAAIMLTNQLQNKAELTQIAQQLGMNDTHFDTNPITTDPSDIGIFFRKLYNGQVVSRQASDQIVTALTTDSINDRIPALLPTEASGSAQELKIAHKTGELPLVRHDAGIVYLPSKPYLIVLMSKDLQYEDDGVSTLAQLSKDVYDYFSKNI